jgi:hypothetical protein
METLFFIGIIFFIGFLKTFFIKKGFKNVENNHNFSSDIITDKIIGVIK